MKKEIKYKGFVIPKEAIDREFYVNYRVINDGNRADINSRVDGRFRYNRDLFYSDGRRRKYITKEIVDMLDLLGWAILYMDDGCYDYRRRTANIYCCVYDKEVQQFFVESLGSKYDIKARISSRVRDGVISYSIVVNNINSRKFLKLVEPFIHSCLLYKMGPLCSLNADRINDASIKHRAESKLYYINNRDKCLERKRKYDFDNKDKISLRKKKYYQDNKERITAKKAIYRANLENRKKSTERTLVRYYKRRYNIDCCINRDVFKEKVLEKYGSIEKFKERFPKCMLK